MTFSKIHIKEKNALRIDKYTALGVLLLIIIGVKVSWRLVLYMDVLFWDEAIYLDRGINFFEMLPKTWGPVYSLWYKFLSLFIQDRVALYYFNFKLTSVLVTVLLYLVMLSLGTQRILAFILAMFFMSSYMNLPVWPHISHFVVIIVLLGVLIAKFHETLLEKVLVWAAAFFVCTYARPEMFFPFILIYFIGIGLFIFHLKRLNKKEIIYTIILTMVVFSVAYKLGTPLTNDDSKRSLGVFLQHYAWRYSEEHHLKNVFWLEFFQINHTQFGDDIYSLSLKKIIFNHPDKFFHHIWLNILDYLQKSMKLVVGFFFPVFTHTFHWLALMIALFIWVIYFSLNQKSNAFAERIKVLLKNNLYSLLILCILFLPSFLVCIYAYPREHYLFLQIPFWLLLIALLISSVSIEKEISYSRLIVLAVFWFFVTPECEDFNFFSLPENNFELSNQKAIAYLKRNFAKTDSVHIFDIEGNVSTLLPKNFRSHASEFYPDTLITPSQFIEKKEIDVIYVSRAFKLFNRISSDSMMRNILHSPESYGYSPVQIDSKLQLLIRKR